MGRGGRVGGGGCRVGRGEVVGWVVVGVGVGRDGVGGGW